MFYVLALTIHHWRYTFRTYKWVTQQAMLHTPKLTT